jgi:nitroimidazol reductase NimA-like FMN-containing flavoprotein (pyridoxamine 5'-phosphate oxidase superfamily)
MTDRRELRILSRDESLELLAGGWIGRVIMSANALPTAMPVNYVLDGAFIVFRSGPGMKLSVAEAATVVAFEVDHFDSELRMGWSVVVTGLARRITGATALRRAEALAIQTWVDQTADMAYISIEIGLVTGRRLVPVPHGHQGSSIALRS